MKTILVNFLLTYISNARITFTQIEAIAKKSKAVKLDISKEIPHYTQGAIRSGLYKE